MPSPTQSVFELVLARPVLTEAGEHPHLVHLWWRAPGQGARVVQVYRDGELVAVSLGPWQRQMWLTCDRRRAHTLELLAVRADDPDAAWRAWPALLRGWQPGFAALARLAVVRDEALPVDALVDLRVDGAPAGRTPLFPAAQPRGGFGALLGIGAFGRDDATGPGLGAGELGAGPLGADGTAWRCCRRDLAAGPHTLSAQAYTGDGQAAGPPLVRAVTIDLPPAPPVNLRVEEDFTLRWERAAE